MNGPKQMTDGALPPVELGCGKMLQLSPRLVWAYWTLAHPMSGYYFDESEQA